MIDLMLYGFYTTCTRNRELPIVTEEGSAKIIYI